MSLIISSWDFSYLVNAFSETKWLAEFFIRIIVSNETKPKKSCAKYFIEFVGFVVFTRKRNWKVLRKRR